MRRASRRRRDLIDRFCSINTASEAVGREALVRYALRPPLAQERLARASDDLVEIALKRPFSDGTCAVQLDLGRRRPHRPDRRPAVWEKD